MLHGQKAVGTGECGNGASSAGNPPLREEPLQSVGLLGPEKLQVEGLACWRAQPPGAAIRHQLQPRLRECHDTLSTPGERA